MVTLYPRLYETVERLFVIERGIVAETTYSNIIMLQGEGGGVRYTQCWCIVFGALLVTAIEQVDFIEGVPISKH